MSDLSLVSEKAKKILAERSAQFAKKKIEITTVSASTLLVFNIGKEQKYALDFDVIDRIIHHQQITCVPGINPLFSGLLYYNSEVWPVINLNILFDSNSSDQNSHFILLYEGSQPFALSVGTIVGQLEYDKSTDLIRLSKEENSQHSYVLGIYHADIAIIDIVKLLNSLKTMQVARINL